MRRLHEERGGILVLSAVMIPLFLLLTALVVDVGNWYTHKRQLQNRADAAALAAGLEYGPQIYHCLSGNATEVANAETEISQQARAYAGDPTYAPAFGGGPDGLPDPSAATNTEIATQANVDVWLNSTNYDGPNGSDGGGPCLSRTVGDDVSDAGGTHGSPLWVDVKVKERDTASLFGGFGINLLRNGARARVELRPAKGITGFVPLGIPDDRIAKARARFINDCTGGQLGNLITLKPLASNPAWDIPGVTLWGPDDGAGNATTSPVPVTFTMPGGLTGCPSGQDYVPISVEVRAAGRPDINLDPPVTCATLAAKPQADCWPETATIRAWATGGDTGGPLSGDTLLVEDVTLSGGTTGCVQDPHYARLTQGATDCTMGASVYLDFDKRYALGGTFEAQLEVAGTKYDLTGPTDNQGYWFASGIRVPLQDPVAPIPVKVDWRWTYKGPGSFEGQDCSKGKGCDQSGTVAVHKVLPTDNGSDYDALTAVKLTTSSSSGEQHSVKLTNAGGTRNYSGYLRVGLKSTLTLGQFSVLRLRSGQRNYSLVCDPRFPTPSTSNTQAAFYFGCRPPYDKNPLTSGTYWWSNYDPTDAEPECPGYAGWFSGTGSPPAAPYPQSPWLCVHADPGNNGYAVTDGIALKTGNCANPAISGLSADCPGSPKGRYVCTNPIHVPGPGDTVDMKDPRIIKIYILPFNAFNNVASGNGTDVPVIDFAAFYVTAWKYQDAVDPCTGADRNGGAEADNDKLDAYNRLPANEKPPQIGGYFIKWVDPGGGAVDSNATCNLNTLTICRAVLVR